MKQCLYKVVFLDLDGEEDYVVSTSKEEASKSLSFLYPEFDGMEIIWSNTEFTSMDGSIVVYGILNR